MNQFNTIPEANLPALAAGKSIAAIRAIDADGTSTSVTPAQAAAALATPLAPVLAPMLGIDKSILTEQLIPGEFWRGTDGSKKQVYIRTFSGTTPTDFGHTGNTHLYHWVWDINAGCQLDQVHVDHGWVGSVDDGNIDAESGEVGYNLFPWGNRFGIVVNTHCKARYLNKPYQLTLKYTKI